MFIYVVRCLNMFSVCVCGRLHRKQKTFVCDFSVHHMERSFLVFLVSIVGFFGFREYTVSTLPRNTWAKSPASVVLANCIEQGHVCLKMAVPQKWQFQCGIWWLYIHLILGYPIFETPKTVNINGGDNCLLWLGEIGFSLDVLCRLKPPDINPAYGIPPNPVVHLPGWWFGTMDFYDFPYAARVLVKNLKAWGPGPLKFLFLNAGKFTSQQAEGPSNS